MIYWTNTKIGKAKKNVDKDGNEVDENGIKKSEGIELSEKQHFRKHHKNGKNQKNGGLKVDDDEEYFEIDMEKTMAE